MALHSSPSPVGFWWYRWVRRAECDELGPREGDATVERPRAIQPALLRNGGRGTVFTAGTPRLWLQPERPATKATSRSMFLGTNSCDRSGDRPSVLAKGAQDAEVPRRVAGLNG